MKVLIGLDFGGALQWLLASYRHLDVLILYYNVFARVNLKLGRLGGGKR